MEISFGSVDSHSIRFTIAEIVWPMDEKGVKQDICDIQVSVLYSNG